MGKVDIDKLEATVRGWKAGTVANEELRAQMVASATEIGVMWPAVVLPSYRDAVQAAMEVRIVQLAEYHVRNCEAWNEATTDGARASIADTVADTNGAFAVVAMLDELIARRTRKTGDGLPTGADFPQGTPPWAQELLAGQRAIIKHFAIKVA